MRHKALPAPAIASVMGFIPSKPLGAAPKPHYGRKALPGQYVRSYKRDVALGAGRVSKGARRRYERDRGTEGNLDYSGVINARR